MQAPPQVDPDATLVTPREGADQADITLPLDQPGRSDPDGKLF